MKTKPLNEYVERRGLRIELAREMGLTPGAISNMLNSGRRIFVDLQRGRPVRLREEKILAEVQGGGEQSLTQEAS